MFNDRHGSPVRDQWIQAIPSNQSLRGSAPARAAVPPIAVRAGGGPLAIVALLAVSISPATLLAAANDQSAGEPIPLEPVVVVSSRSPRPSSEVVGMVGVLDDADIATRMATHEDGLWRYTPGIQVESSGSRFSARSLSIRGIGGNRVVMEVDGIPIQDRLAVGNFAFAGRTGAALDFVRRIEVLRGPASSLYGSKAIGGVVAVSTFDPHDLAAAPGALHGRLGASYSGDWDSTGASALGAWQGEAMGALLGGSLRRGHELDRSADPPNPDRMDREHSAMLAKLTLADGRAGRLRLTLDGDRDETESALNSVVGQGRFANTTALTGDDRATRTGIALDGHAELGSWNADGALFHRQTRTRQETMDLREGLAEPVRVDREFRYETDISGARGHVTREFRRGGFRHRVMLGAEVARSRLEESRDALQTRLSDGESTNVVLGERFPLRDFPVTVSEEAGVFLQDEIDSLAGHVTVIPSLRFDRTRIRVRDDEAWRQANPEAELAELTVSDVSPRLGVLWRPSRRLQAWGQLVSGFRAPPAEDLNIGLDIPLFNIRALPNPDLQSETSLGWELGLRANARGAWLSAAAFWTDYEDFIDSLVPLGPDPETGTLLFQSQNLERVRIKGIELEAGAPLGTLMPALDAFTVGLSGYWADGENRRSGEDLDDVGPLSAVLYLDWASRSGRWDARISGLFARAGNGAIAGSQEFFATPGHGIVDLSMAWRATERLTIRAGAFNLGDKTWWRPGDVQQLPANDPLVPALSAPGRSVSLAFSLGLGPGNI